MVRAVPSPVRDRVTSLTPTAAFQFVGTTCTRLGILFLFGLALHGLVITSFHTMSNVHFVFPLLPLVLSLAFSTRTLHLVIPLWSLFDCLRLPLGMTEGSTKIEALILERQRGYESLARPFVGVE